MLRAAATTSSPMTSTAPTGVSPMAEAFSASARARRMKSMSVGDCILKPLGPEDHFPLCLRYRIAPCVFSVRMLVRPRGFEPLAYGFVVRCSIQLSYGRTIKRTDEQKAHQ